MAVQLPTYIRHPEPFQPGELVYVRAFGFPFHEDLAYEVKAGPNVSGLYEIWSPQGPRRYELIHDRFLVAYPTPDGVNIADLTKLHDGQSNDEHVYTDPIKLDGSV